MQEEYIDTADQLIEEMFADQQQDDADITLVPAIQIVHFDDRDHPVDAETRPLHSFL